MDDMQEQLEKRDMVLRYFKQVDYSLKPSKEIYTRIKTKIIGLSGINAKPEMSYSELCKAAGLDLKEGKALIESLFNKELIHMIKKYDALLLNQEVETFYVDKQYAVGAPVPDIAMITHEQALDYIMGLINMKIMLKTFNNVNSFIFQEAIDNLKMVSDNDRARLHKALVQQNKTGMLMLAASIDEAITQTGGLKIDILKNCLIYIIENVKKIDLLQNVLTDAIKKNPNVSNKFYTGSCEVNDVKYYLFPI